MLNLKQLNSIATIDDLRGMKKDKLSDVVKVARKNIHKTQPDAFNIGYTIHRAFELLKSSDALKLESQKEKILFVSEIIYHNTDKIFDLIKKYGISYSDIILLSKYIQLSIAMDSEINNIIIDKFSCISKELHIPTNYVYLLISKINAYVVQNPEIMDNIKNTYHR